MKSKVMCNSCRKKYDAIFVESYQANGCAATVHFSENVIQGYYGSNRYDMKRYVFGENIPDWVNEGVICDDCITKLLKEGHIKFSEHLLI